MDNIELTEEKTEEVTETKPVEVVESVEEIKEPELKVEENKLEKSYILFAELQGTLESETSETDRFSKLKELKSELDSIIGYKDPEIEEIKSNLESKIKDFDEVKSKYDDLSKKYSALSEQNKALSVLAKEFKAAKTGPLATEEVAMVQKTPQEIYDELLKTDPVKASAYANKIRFGR